MAVFLAVIIVGIGFASGSAGSDQRGILGGPTALLAVDTETRLEETMLTPIVGLPGSLGDEEKQIDFSTQDFDFQVASFSFSDGSVGDLGGLITYRVKRGDTLSHIAYYFGISVSDIISANPGIRATGIQIGQEIKILLNSGIVYQVELGDTLESIASLFSVSEQDIIEFNDLIGAEMVTPGSFLVIPGDSLLDKFRYTGDSKLPDLGSYFSLPTKGFNWGQLHDVNAVDIANSCGTTVTASAEGLVVPDEDYGNGNGDWNGGYGSFVLIEHPNGTKTRYAHLQDVFVEIGDYIKKGESIGTMGNTGNVHGPTGCHLHFEVLGAKNPFAKY